MNFAADDGFTAREDTVWAFGEEGHPVVSIYEGEIERQRAEDPNQLFQTYMAGGQHQSAGMRDVDWTQSSPDKAGT